MKALTIWQPWASLIMIGAKPYEFRSWLAPRSICGTRIVIHAGARQTRQGEFDDLIERLRNPEMAWSTCLKAEVALPFLLQHYGPSKLPLGAGLGTAVVGVSREGSHIAKEFGGDPALYADLPENWGWPLVEIERWDEPIIMKGMQGLWNWPTPEDSAL